MPVISIRPVGIQDIAEGAGEGAAIGGELGGPWGAVAGGLLGGLAGADAVEVSFSCRDGSIRVYRYEGAAAKAILAGANPSRFSGTRIS
jgi:hypothetical protein